MGPPVHSLPVDARCIEPMRGAEGRMPGKVATMRDAVAELVRDGDTVAIEGFTHLIGFSAGHEIIRQRRRDLTLARMTPDVIYDQMIAGGVARKLVFSWLGKPGVGGLKAIRGGIEPAAGGGGARAGVATRSGGASSPRRSERGPRSRSRSTATSGWSPATPPAPRTCRSCRCGR